MYLRYTTSKEPGILVHSYYLFIHAYTYLLNTYFNSDINECSSGPCDNGGSCVDQVNHYTCHCKPGYRGGRCETGIY